MNKNLGIPVEDLNGLIVTMSIEEAIKTENYAQALKGVRDQFRVGVKTAKDICDLLKREYGLS